MPWDRSRPGGTAVAAKYRDPAYLAACRQARADLERDGQGVCAETRNPGSRCTQPSPAITPGMDLHMCHHAVTGDLLGLGHAACNRSDGARRARARQAVTRLTW